MAPLDARIDRGWRLGLEEMRCVLGRIGPLDYPVILVGGTNGKGSVACRVASILHAHGLKTGLTISPHLVDVRERIAVDGRVATAEEFEGLFASVAAVDEDKPTYFETLALMACLHFQNEKVDAAVVEIGLGGRLDAFNALDPLVSVVTNVGLEHTEYLGDTIEKIAVEKAQIARPGRVFVVGQRLPVLRGEAERLGARVIFVDTERIPTYDERNAAVARVAAGEFLHAMGRPLDWEKMKRGERLAEWPCRFEVVESPEGTAILDGAHNPDGALALAERLEAFRETGPPGSRRVVALAGFMKDKDIPGFLSALQLEVDEWIFSKCDDPRAADFSGTALPENARWIPDPAEAWEAARSAAGVDGILLATGSLYFLGELIRSNLTRSAVHDILEDRRGYF